VNSYGLSRKQKVRIKSVDSAVLLIGPYEGSQESVVISDLFCFDNRW